MSVLFPSPPPPLSSSLLLLLLLLLSAKTPNKGWCGQGCDLEKSSFAQSWGLAPPSPPPLKRAVPGDGTLGGVGQGSPTSWQPCCHRLVAPACAHSLWGCARAQARALGPGRLESDPGSAASQLGRPGRASPGCPGLTHKTRLCGALVHARHPPGHGRWKRHPVNTLGDKSMVKVKLGHRLGSVGFRGHSGHPVSLGGWDA